MDERVKTELGQLQQSNFHKAIMNHVIQLARMSRAAMSQHYTQWDINAMTYKARISPNKDDTNAKKKDEPVRLAVPLTFAQVQTFIAFCFLLYTQNEKLYEFQPTGDEDYPIRKDAERFVDRDIKRNQFLVKLYQFLLDIGRFNIGIIEHSWDEDYVRVPVTALSQPSKLFGIQLGKGKLQTTMKKVLRYQGNKIRNVSPWRFYPDTRLPLSEFQDGEFCGSEDEISMSHLAKLQDSDEVAGIAHVRPVTEEMLKDRTGTRLGWIKPFETGKGEMTADLTRGNALVTKMQVKLIPNEFKLDDGKPLGTEEFPVCYNVWIANDTRVIKCEPLGHLHGQFTYDVGQSSPDMHEVIGQGLSDIIDYLQSTITWFVNSHITSIKKTIDTRFVVDPAGIDTKSLEARGPYIYMKKGKSGSGVDRWIKQLQVLDATSGHMDDVDKLTKLMQLITGVNDNAMGQYNSGRRSATESRAVTAGAASRLKVSAIVIWTMALDPLGRKLLVNLRQGISQETFARVVGRPKQNDAQAMEGFQLRFDAFKGTPEELVGADDFFNFDATLPSEKGFIAQSLQELLQIVLANPESAQALDINPKALLDEVYELRGVQNMSRFSLSAAQANEPAQINAPGAAGGVTPPTILPTPTAAAA